MKETRRIVLIGLAICLVPQQANAQRRYRTYVRRRRRRAQIAEPEQRIVSALRIIPLPTKLAPTFHDHWMERIGWWFK